MDADGAAVDAYLPCVGRVQAEQYVHQGRLSSAVLTEQAEHLARVQGQIHRAIGIDAAETLVDGAHLEQRWLSHGVGAFAGVGTVPVSLEREGDSLLISPRRRPSAAPCRDR